MKDLPRGLWLAIAGLIIAFLALAVVEKAQMLAHTVNAAPDKTISMSAEGKTSATPDLATVTVGVVSSGTTAQKVQDDMSGKVNKITDFVKQQGIDAKDITTANFNVYPNYDYTNGKNTITGYQGSETISIKIRGVDKSTDKVSKVLDGATANGSNQIQGISFSFDDPDSLKGDARKQAIDKAKQKAQELADQTGLRLGRIVNVSEGSSNPGVMPMPYAMDSKAVGQGGGGPAANIEAGSQDIVVDVTVTFELK